MRDLRPKPPPLPALQQWLVVGEVRYWACKLEVARSREEAMLKAMKVKDVGADTSNLWTLERSPLITASEAIFVRGVK